MRLIRSKKIVPPSMDLPRRGYSRVAVDPAQLERLWDAWATAALADVMLSIYPSIVLSEMSRCPDKMVILLRCLAASGTGAAVRIAAAMSAGYGPPVYKEESMRPYSICWIRRSTLHLRRTRRGWTRQRWRIISSHGRRTIG